MANEDKGQVTCPFCKSVAPVRKNAKLKFYINCPRDGVIQPALPQFQDWIMEHATIYGAEGKPVIDTAPAPAPGPTPTPTTAAPVEKPTPPKKAPPAKTSEEKPSLFGFMMK